MKNSIFFAAFLVAGCFTALASGQNNVAIGNAVPANQQVSIDNIDHSLFNQLLQFYVNDKGQVNYKGWKESQNANQALDSYLTTLSSANPDLDANRANKLAFWINAYNAVTIKGILREYPTTSIRNHTSETGGYNLWKNLFLPVVHFAIVCASHSCPRLMNQAYVGKTLEAQLTTNTRNFFANPENFQYDAQRRALRLSEIVQWFSSDFGATQAAQLQYLSPYLPTREAQAAAQQNAVGVSYLNYSWALNEQKPMRKAVQPRKVVQ